MLFLRRFQSFSPPISSFRSISSLLTSSSSTSSSTFPPSFTTPHRATQISSFATAMVHSKFLSHDYLTALTHHITRSKKTTLPQITEFLNLYKTNMNADNFLTFMTCVGKRQFLTPYHIYIVACGLKFVNDGKTILTLSQLDQLFNSLKFMSPKIGGVRCLVDVAADKFQENNEPLSSNRIGNYLLSLRDMKAGHLEVRKLLKLFSTKIQTKMCENLTTEDFVRGLNSCSKLSSRYAEVGTLLSTLNQALLASTDRQLKFTTSQVPLVLFGFSRLSPEVKEVREILGTVISKIDSTSLNGLNSNEVSQAFASISEITSTQSTEVRSLLLILTSIVNGTEAVLSKEFIDKTLELLKTIQQSEENNNIQELRALIAVIEKRVTKLD